METKQMCSNFEKLDNFSYWLGHQLDMRRMTVVKLSKISGVHANTIHNYLAGRCEPTFFNAKCLVEALGYDLGVTRK
jgi:hypothetical protein